MSNDLTTFNFNGATLRATVIDGDPWFVGVEVATLLGYAKPGLAIKAHCRGAAIYSPIPDALGREQETRMITEGDVYRLAMRSRLPAAERFETWVVDTVIPSLRKHGGYTMGQEKVETGEMDRELLLAKALQAMQSVLAEADEKVARLAAANARALPDVSAMRLSARTFGAAWITRSPSLPLAASRAITFSL